MVTSRIITRIELFELFPTPRTIPNAHGYPGCEVGYAYMGQKGQASLWGTINSLCTLCTPVLEVFQQLGCSCLQEGVTHDMLQLIMKNL